MTGRWPAFNVIAPNQDDGHEKFEDFDLWLNVRGSCTVEILGHTFEMRAGSLIIVPVGVAGRHFTGPRDELLMMFLHFDCKVDGQIITDASPYVNPAELSLTLPGIPAISLVAEVDSDSLSGKLRSIRNRPRDDLSQLMLNIALMNVLQRLRQTYLGLADSVAEDRLARITEFLEQNLHRSISLAEVADHVHVSEKTLRRLFRTHYHMSPIQYLTNLRMERARVLLQGRRHDISEIAYACGYSSPQYFSRAFSKVFNMSPTDYRNRISRIS